MVKTTPYIKIIRPVNAAMAGSTACLGFLLVQPHFSAKSLFLLCVATVSALGFGNTVNDIRDMESDRISHPSRPLPTGEAGISGAIILSIILAAISLLSGRGVSTAHFIGAAAPILLLLLYSFLLKGTPLAGNILVSLLVGYTLLYGGLGAKNLNHLYAPAVCAFLLNLSREIIKDIQDEAGDRITGLRTTALIPVGIIRTILIIAAAAYLAVIFIPWQAGHFGVIYLSICISSVIPLHIFWITKLFTHDWKNSLGKMSLLIKIEMLIGIAALACDRFFYFLK